MKNKSKKGKDIAIKVEKVSKTFRIPHEKNDTMKSVFVNMFKKKTYEEFNALKNISFEIKKGEFFGIIGRNGSGKSTLLKIIAGIYGVDSGRVKVNGRISPFLELGIGFNPNLSGRDNVYLNATVLGLTRKEIDKKFDEIVKFSELERFIDQKLKNYSSGMSVRLAFSVSIHANRDILLMDEVLAVGDSNFQSKCLEEFNHYRDLGKTVLLVTHSIETIQKYCGQAILLRNGRIEKIGNSKDIGNAYIYQNISDEEGRMSKEKETRGKGMKGGGKSNEIAEVVKIELLDEDNKDKNVFETGEQLRVKINYVLYEKNKDLIFGIVIRDEMGKNVFATNTDFKKIETGLMSKGKAVVFFDIENYFASGTYSISPAIATKNKKILNWKDDLRKFRIINKSYNSGGIADFPHVVSINKNSNKLN